MARYYFHLLEGIDVLIDEEGRELANPAAISAIAMADARSIISADALLGRIDLDQRIEVLNMAGATVHRLEFEDAVVLVGPARNLRVRDDEMNRSAKARRL